MTETIKISQLPNVGVLSGTELVALVQSGVTKVATTLQIADLAISDANVFLLKANNLSDVASVSSSRTNLGLGTIATQNADAVAITGGSITGITDLAVADGGTGTGSLTAYAVLCGGTTATGAVQSVASVGTLGQALISNGPGALPTFQTIPGVSGQALTRTDDTNVTLTLGGTPATALLEAASITAGWTGQLSIGRGGTGQATAGAAFDALAPTTTRGDLIARGASSNGRLAVGTSGYALISDGTDPAWTGFLQAGSGATARTWQAKNRDVVSVKDFGAVGNGVADDTSAVQAAIDAVGVAGGSVYFPPGTYLLSAALVMSSNAVVLVGDSRYGTLLRQTTTNTNILTISGQFCGVSGLSFIYAGTPTSGGTAIAISGGYCTLEDFVIRSAYVGVSFVSGAVAGKVTTFEILDYESVGISVNGTNDVFIDAFIMNAGNTTRGALGGIRLANKAEAVIVSNGDILLGAYSMTTDAASDVIGARPAYNNFTNVFFDSSVNGCAYDKLYETEFVGCWWSGGRSGSGSPGMTFSTGSSNRFVSSRFFNCGSHGASVLSGASKISFVGCSFESNSVTTGAGVSNGLSIAASADGIIVMGCQAGNGLYTGTQGYGVSIGSSATNIFVVHNDLTDNATAGLINSSTSSTNRIYGNSGSTLNDVLFSSTVAATPALTVLNTNDAQIVTALRIEGDRATPASFDRVGAGWWLSNGSGTQKEVSRLEAWMETITAGAETSSLHFHVMSAWTLARTLYLNTARLTPVTSDGLALGSGTAMWSDLFLASGGVINFNNGNLTLTHSAGALAINGVATLASATATPAGGSTSARLLLGTTSGFGIYYGSGAPTVSAGQGSIYLRSDGSSTATRLYVNTDGSTGWTNATTAA